MMGSSSVSTGKALGLLVHTFLRAAIARLRTAASIDRATERKGYPFLDCC